MIRALFNGGVIDYIIQTICMLPGIIIGLSMHEFSHALVADKCGDPTPRLMGRLSVDPRAHIDPVGLLALILVHFGWGRPVIINPANFNNRRRDSIFVALAGVAMNFAIGTAVGILIRLLIRTEFGLMFFGTTNAGSVLFDILIDIVVINYGLMFFNLLPVPPLDGFNLITDLFNLRGTKIWNMLYRYGNILLIVIILADIPSFLISRPMNWLVNAICFGYF